MSELTEAEARIKSVKFQCITATLEGVLAMAQTEATLRKSDSWAFAAGLLRETLKELEEFNPKSANAVPTIATLNAVD